MDAINVSQEQVKSKREIGTLNKSPVFHVSTKGGLNMILSAQNGKIKYHAAAPHVSVAKYIAEKNEPNIQWTELSKSEDGITVDLFKSILPEYEALTKKLNELA